MIQTSMAILQEAQVFMHANVVSTSGAFRSPSLNGSHLWRVFHISCQGPLAARSASFRSIVSLRSAIGDSGDQAKHYESVFFKEQVQEVMSGPAITLTADKTTSDAVILMLKHKIHRIPFVNNTKQVVGLHGKDKLMSLTFKVELPQNWCLDALLSAWISFPVSLSFSGFAHAEVFNQQMNQIYGDLGDGLEIGAQALYLAALLGLVGVASYFVVRQVLIRRDLESAARDLQDRVRTGEAMPVEYFELGAVMLRKKFYPLASKYLEQAIAKWDEDPQDLAQVHNALGYSYVNDNLVDRGIAEYLKALKLQPGYVVAWNNLGSAYEKKKNLPKALEAYEQALRFDPNNDVAKEYRDALKKRVERLEGVPVKYD